MPDGGAILFEGADWTFDGLGRVYDAIERVARKDLGLDIYPNRIEIISSEQMLDAYSSVGMPNMYRHWSFGKHFVHHERAYRAGLRGLAYEIVINSDPCISYCLEENSMAMQALVIAHAAFGHNHFFKSNHLFRLWTDAAGIIDYLEYARGFIAKAEERHGLAAVEAVLDAAHALMPASVFRHRRPLAPTPREEEARRERRREDRERSAHYLWSSIEAARRMGDEDETARERKRGMNLPEENILHFLENCSPVLKPWEREILSIVRNIAQYFYPQKQTKVMNEGCATFVHHYILTRMHEQGLIHDGAMLEILHSHANVLFQPDYDDPRYSGINPYALGFAMMQDIRRMCEAPTDEDREWCPGVAGSGDWAAVLREAWANYRDESFIQQFLSPAVMRRFRFFALGDDGEAPWYTVGGIHDERGYLGLREALARAHDVSAHEPDLQVADVDLLGDRRLHLRRLRTGGVPLDKADAERTLAHLRRLWGYEVTLDEEG